MADRVFAMPDLGEGLEQGEIVAWLVAEGESVELNQPLVEIETAKATVEIPSPHAGRIVTLHGSVGSSVPVGSALVTFAVADGVDGGGGSAGESPPTPRSAAAPVRTQSDLGGSARIERAATTPAVRRLARDLGVDVSSVHGSGRGGRVTAEDVQAASSPAAGEGERIDPVTPVRREIARRLSEVAAVPQVTTFRTVDCSALEAFRAELSVSPLPVVVTALARMCADHPLLNASWRDDGIHLFDDVNVGIATDTERGLMVPVLGKAQMLGIGAVAAGIARLAEAARGGQVRQDDLRGATIGVSNTGSYGSEAGTPLLNPGNAATLALGVIAPRALVVGGDVVARPACTLSLTFDHRVMDGAAAGRALTDLIRMLSDAEALGRLPR
jgi:pyruvate/2-oxoglutarate dehydrogenase complex dihydrolipoamide acyltransferase (E2) component